MKTFLDFSKICPEGETPRGLKWKIIPDMRFFTLELKIPEEKAVNVTGAMADGHNTVYLKHWRNVGLQFCGTAEGDWDYGNVMNDSYDLNTCGINFIEAIDKFIISEGRYYPTEILIFVSILCMSASNRILTDHFATAFGSFANGLFETIVLGLARDRMIMNHSDNDYWIDHAFWAKHYGKLLEQLPDEARECFKLPEH